MKSRFPDLFHAPSPSLPRTEDSTGLSTQPDLIISVRQHKTPSDPLPFNKMCFQVLGEYLIALGTKLTALNTIDQSPAYSSVDANMFVSKAPPDAQWYWTNPQCRSWIKLICLDYLDFTPEEAERTTLAFGGVGATLFLMTAEDWGQFLGSSGAGVYGWVLGAKGKKGGVPSGLATVERGADS